MENAIWGSDWSLRTTDDLWMGAKDGRNPYQTGGLQHLLPRHIVHEVGRAVFDEYFKFTFVRNPWDKAVSQYHYTKTRGDLMRHLGMGRMASFARYLRLTQKVEHVQWAPQVDFVFNESGDPAVDFVGRFEHLQRDFGVVTRRLNLPIDLPHVNASSRARDLNRYYRRPWMVDFVAEVYSRDVEAFGYAYPGAD